MQELDPRIVRVAIEVNGKIKTYDKIAITASGTKYGNPIQNEATITLTNLDKQTQDYILTETSPYTLNRTPKSVTVFAGRQSYGTATIYKGNIVSSSVSQPPDITVTLKCLTGNFLKGNILSRSQPGSVTLQQAAKGVAQDTGTILDFQADDKNLANYSYSGAALKQVDYLAQAGGIDVFLDDNLLVVKGQNIPLTGTTRIIDAASGMIGIPEFTEQGIKVKFLLDNKTRVGGGLRVKSSVYPAVNGDYVIYKLSFDIANRDTPFYYIAEAVRRK